MPKTVVLACSDATSLRNFRGRLIETMRAAGHKVIVLAPEFSPQMQRWCEERGLITETSRIRNQGLNPVTDLRSIAGLTVLMRRFRPDVVMGYTHKPALYTAFAAKLAGVRHVTMMVTGLGFGFEPGPGLKAHLVPAITRTLFRIGCALCDKVIFHNADNRDFFLREGILKTKSKAVVVGGSGVDLTLFPPRPLPALKSGALTFLSIGRIVRYKGMLEYARAAAALREEFPAARFLLAGYWDANPLSYRAEEWAFIQASLTYLGKTDDPSGLIAQADVYVLPSYGEGMPRTVLEAMAIGRPVITTDTYGCRDTVQDGVNGLLVPIKAWEPLRDAMRRFLVDPELRERMAGQSLARVRERFDVEAVNRDMMRALGL